jgi:DNA-binding transcriptional MocR family regulator
MLKGQDILLLLKLALVEGDKPPRQIDLAQALGLSQAEVYKALGRCAESGLLDAETRHVRRQALLEFLEHGFKYVFPARLGEPTRGIPTAWAGPDLSKDILSGDNEKPVWASPDGTERGNAVEPIYPTVPQVAQRDAQLYSALAYVDALRLGRARERQIAIAALKKLLADRR